MANSEQRIRKYVADEKRKGTASAKIIVGITKLDGQTGKDAQKMVKALRDAGLSPSQELGAYFGLDYQTDVSGKKPVNKNPTLGQKAKSYLDSTLLGLADSVGGVFQGVAYAGDEINEGINSVAGTSLETNAYEKLNKDRKLINKEAANTRADAGRNGGDWVRGGTEIAATVPAFFIGGGAGQGFKQTAQFAGRQAGIGAGVGAARYADSGKERAGNMAGGAIGGAVGGVIGEKVAAPLIGKTVSKVMRRTANKSGATATAATKLVDDAITETGIKVNQATRNRLVNDATKNLSKSKQIDAAAAVRKSLLEDNGFKGTQAQLSKRPEEWRAERELAKNNSDLNNTHIGNNEQLTSKWESLVDETGTRPIDNTARLESTFQTLNDGDANTRATINKLYDDAKALSGGDIEINHARFIDDMTEHLTYNIDEAYVPKVRNLIEGVVKQDGRLTLKGVESVKKRMNTLIGSTSDGSYRYALNEAKRMLDDEVIKSGGDFIQAAANNPALAGRKAELDLAAEGFAKARGAARDRFQDLDNNPALRAALDDASPDKGFSKLVLNSDKRDLVKLVDTLKKSPQGQQNLADLQGATIEHFITKATGADNGAFSTAQLNKAIDAFGNDKMRALFTPEQIARINDIQKVGDILMQRPQGAHINDSNTASTLINQLIGIANMTGKIPVLGNVGIGAAKAVGDLAQSGAGAKMINGQPAITRGSSLGLTDEQLEMLGMIPQRTGVAGAALGAGEWD